VEVLQREGSVVLVVADGAGNSARGAMAAQRIVAVVRGALLGPRAPGPWDVDGWAALLAACDGVVAREADGGETTAVVACVGADFVGGASVGDSEAWLRTGGETRVLTEAQQRKPLLGSGKARPVGFLARWPQDATLLLASDGLFKHAPRDALEAALAGAELEAVADALLALPRLPSGVLPDDVGLALLR
jgi:serine/threonine protein phosphatase PrpC